VPAVGRLGTKRTDKASPSFVAATAENRPIAGRPQEFRHNKLEYYAAHLSRTPIYSPRSAPATCRSIRFRGQKLQNIVADVMNTPSDEVEDVNAIMRKPH
jgi:hypothetical protein